MARQIHYDNQLTGGATVDMPMVPHVPQPSIGGIEANAALFKQATDLGQDVLKAYALYQNKKQEGLVEEADLALRDSMLRWGTEYMKTHQGVSALDAQRDFDQHFSEVAQNIRKHYNEQLPNNDYKHALERKIKLRSLEALVDGFSYQQKQEKIWNKSLDDGAIAAFESDVSRYYSDPDRLKMRMNEVIRGWEARHPGEDSTAIRLALQEKLTLGGSQAALAAGNPDVAEKILWGGTGPGSKLSPGIGNSTAHFESGSKGIYAIGFDENGGTSYGKWQLSSRMGSFMVWLKYLSKQGEAGKAAAEHILAAGNSNTGSRKGAVVDAYLEEAKKNPELFERTQWEFNKKYHYDPMLAKLDPKQREQIESNKALQEMAWSTSVQHGGAGGASILRKVWKPGMSNEEMAGAVYDERGKHFGSSTADVQASVRNRFKQEKAMILGWLKNPGAQQTGTAQSALASYDNLGFHFPQTPKAEQQSTQVQQEKTSAPQQAEATPKQDTSRQVPAGVDPGKALAMQSHIDTFRKRQAAELKLTEGDFNNRIAYGIEKGDFSKAEEAVNKLSSLDPSKAQPYQSKLEVAKLYQGLIAGNEDTPLAELSTKVSSEFDKVLKPENAQYAVGLRDHLKSAIESKIKNFQTDPAAYIATNKLLQDKNLSPEERISRSLMLQKQIGKGIMFTPRFVSKQEAEVLRNEFNSFKNGVDRAEFIKGLIKNYGQYSDEVMSEMKLPPQLSALFPVLSIMDNNTLGVCITAILAGSGQLPKEEQDRLDEIKEVTSVDSFDLYKVAKDLENTFPNMDYLHSFATGMQKMGINYLKLTGKDNFNDLNQYFKVASENGCIFILPNATTDYDVDDLVKACEYYREKGLLKKKFLESGVLTYIFRNNRLGAANLKSIIENSIFVSAKDGEHMFVFDAKSGHAIGDKNGNLIMLKNKDVLKAVNDSQVEDQDQNEAD